MNIQAKFSLKRRTFYPWVFLILSISIAGTIFYFGPDENSLELFIALMGPLGGTTAFLYTQHNQQTILFRQLFTEFNARYDKLNGKLNDIHTSCLDKNYKLNSDEINTLFDYFNLCAEEYLFFEAGFIDSKVWNAWYQGMLHFSKCPQISELWTSELNNSSYYGFPLPKRE